MKIYFIIILLLSTFSIYAQQNGQQDPLQEGYEEEYNSNEELKEIYKEETATEASEGTSEIDVEETVIQSDPYFEEDVPIRNLDNVQWAKFEKELDYTEKKKPKKEIKKDKSENNPTSPGNDIAPLNFGPAGIFIAYGLLFLLIVFIIFKVLNINLGPSNKSISATTKEFDLETLEEEMMESDLEKYLKDALSQQQYKLAIRIYFLIILKDLTLNKWINWKKDKLNRDYLFEMSSREEYGKFSEVTRIYERAWYGESMIGEAEYKSVSPHFENFIQKIRKEQA